MDGSKMQGSQLQSRPRHMLNKATLHPAGNCFTAWLLWFSNPDQWYTIYGRYEARSTAWSCIRRTVSVAVMQPWISQPRSQLPHVRCVECRTNQAHAL